MQDETGRKAYSGKGSEKALVVLERGGSALGGACFNLTNPTASGNVAGVLHFLRLGAAEGACHYKRRKDKTSSFTPGLQDCDGRTYRTWHI